MDWIPRNVEIWSDDSPFGSDAVRIAWHGGNPFSFPRGWYLSLFAWRRKNNNNNNNKGNKSHAHAHTKKKHKHTKVRIVVFYILHVLFFCWTTNWSSKRKQKYYHILEASLPSFRCAKAVVTNREGRPVESKGTSVVVVVVVAAIVSWPELRVSLPIASGSRIFLFSVMLSPSSFSSLMFLPLLPLWLWIREVSISENTNE